VRSSKTPKLKIEVKVLRELCQDLGLNRWAAFEAGAAFYEYRRPYAPKWIIKTSRCVEKRSKKSAQKALKEVMSDN
jgi:hypothetical protein